MPKTTKKPQTEPKEDDTPNPRQPAGTIGTLVDGHKAMIATTEAGTAKDSKSEYTLGTAGWFGGGPPVVYNPKTKQYFTLSWEEIVKLARDAGIDKE